MNNTHSFRSHFLLVSMLMMASLSLSANETNRTAYTENTEEARIDSFNAAYPDAMLGLLPSLEPLIVSLDNLDQAAGLAPLVSRLGATLWQSSTEQLKNDPQLDDRPLYWARLTLSRAIKQKALELSIPISELSPLLTDFEQASRGIQDINFNSNAYVKILLTGFDPFFLDRNIGQSNPSGVTAQALDGKRLIQSGVEVQIETAVVPVRYADFDQGMIENMVTDYLEKNRVDMLVTVSMGRQTFDLERFPGRRRSAKAPDNLNHFTGASQDNPLPPYLNGNPLIGPEFVEFSLPVEAMLEIQTPFVVNDNHQVRTLQQGQFNAARLSQLLNQTSVAGSGGGYLSNEISYRTLRVAKQVQSKVKVGHIHTPRIRGFDAQTSRQILQQIEQMLRASIVSLKP